MCEDSNASAALQSMGIQPLAQPLQREEFKTEGTPGNGNASRVNTFAFKLAFKPTAKHLLIKIRF